MNITMPGTWGCTCGGCGCSCCEGTESLTPESTTNRPGLSALRYRVGTHGSFLETMKARLSSHVLDASLNASGDSAPQPTRPLAGLRLRDGSDPAIALLDAWATVADVLSFYQERIANEGYLRTATERRSLFELARLIGYQPRPGVAASVYLAYTIDANTPQEIVVPKGARAQTIPGQNELPQSFETSQDLKARAAWNQLGLRQTEPQQWQDIESQSLLYLAGTQTRLKAGDPLLIDRGDPASAPTPWRILAIETDIQADRTAMTIESWEPSARVDKIGAHLLSLVKSELPDGVMATEVRIALSHLNEKAKDSRQFTDLLGRARTLVQAQQGKLGLRPARKLRPWLADVAVALDALQARNPATTADSSSFADRIGKLIKPASTPRANALQLPHSLASSFESIGDAGLKVLGAVAPTLKTTLAPALAGYEAAAPPQPIRVWAMRLQTGLFGRMFPARTKTESAVDHSNDSVTISRTRPDGEWPIVIDVDESNQLITKESPETLYLDGSYGGITPNSWIFVDSSAVPDDPLMMIRPEAFLVARVKSVSTKISRAEYGGSGDATRVLLATVSDEPAAWIHFMVGDEISINDIRDARESLEVEHDFLVIRRTVVYAQSELLTLAERPITEPLCSEHAAAPGEPIELDGLYTDLEAGRFVIVSGERADVGDTRGVFASEPVMITSVVHDVRAAGTQRGPWTHVADDIRSGAVKQGRGQELEVPSKLPGDKNHTFIWIDKPLSYCYRRDKVTILGNVVRATHGETRIETLGSGDGAKPLQHFELKQSPLTHLPAPTAAGAESTLSVYVNDVRWQEAVSFVGQASTDRIYRVQIDDQGKTLVQFGNGREGARLPTGFGNVKAVYRNGIGRPGNTGPGRIQQLATRPLGVKEVTNPLRSSGGANPESRDQVRRNAPLAVKSLDRLVSTADYADFTRTFAGIGKADAQEISDGRRSLVHVTIAGLDDIPIDSDSDLIINLRRALRDQGDPFQPLTVEPRELRLLIISARLRIDPDYLWEPVVTNVRSALLIAFGFEQRELAQGVASSEVLSVIQSVRGVVYVDLDVFGAIDTTMVAGNDPPRPRTPEETADAVGDVVAHGVAPIIQARPARRAQGSGVLPAQLALLSSEVAETLVLNQLT